MAPDFILLSVEDPLASADFYEHLLGVAPVDRAPTFSLFVFGHGLKLGLWQRDEVEPTVSVPAGAVELCFTVSSPAEVTARWETWSSAGVAIIQKPTAMDFGFTFTATDLDGHRLRVFCPGSN